MSQPGGPGPAGPGPDGAALARALGPEWALLAPLGAGAQGSVWRAREAGTGREVALKLLADASDPARLARFEREGALAARLRHPGIVTVHQAGRARDGRPFIVFDLVEDARPLDAAWAGLAPAARAALLVQVARALGHAHAHGVVHRDVKPENVLVDREGRARLTDFGLGRADGLERLTRTGAVVGTPYYMAPELLRGKGAAPGPTADVWALGVLLFEALAGARPFEGESFLALASAIAAAEPRLPRGVDPRLAAVCGKALARRPEDRYPDGDAFADDLELALAGRPVSASASSAVLEGARRLRRPLLLAAPLLAATALGALLLVLAPGAPAPAPAPRTPPAPTPAPTPPTRPPTTPGPEATTPAARTLRVGAGPVLACHLGERLVTGCLDRLAVWDPAEGRRLVERAHGLGALNALERAGPDALALGGAGGVARVTLGAGDALVLEPLSAEPCTAIAAALDGRRLVLALGESGRVVALDLEGPRRRAELGEVGWRCNGLALAPSGGRLAAIGHPAGTLASSRIVVWEDARAGGEAPPRWRTELAILAAAVAWVDDRELVVGLTTGAILRLDGTTGERLGELAAEPEPGDPGAGLSMITAAHPGPVRVLLVEGDRLHSACGRADRQPGASYRTWDLPRGRLLTTLDIQFPARSADLHPTRPELVIGRTDGVVLLLRR